MPPRPVPAAWLPLAAKYGVGSLIALYLTQVVASLATTDLKAVSADVHVVQQQLADHAARMEALDSERQRNDHTRLILLRAICFNTATNTEASAMCRATAPESLP